MIRNSEEETDSFKLNLFPEVSSAKMGMAGGGATT